MPTSRFICQRLLLTNDDGFDAPGLQVLEEVAAELAPEVWVVAPLTDQSGTSHSISIHQPLRAVRHDERRYALSGTPGDCVAWALRHLLVDRLPDLVLSGINRGANLGVETLFSGTVGGAMMAHLLGVPAIALSQAFTDRAQVPWATAAACAPQFLRRLVGAGWPADTCLNVNFPDRMADQVGRLRVTRQGRGYLADVQVQTARDPRDQDYHWLKLYREARPDHPDSEATRLHEGDITVTPLMFERTQTGALAELERRLEGL